MHTPVALTVEKKELFITLPYLGNVSLTVRTRLQNSRVSQLGSTSGGGGEFGQSGQKLHENDKIGIFGSKQWVGGSWGDKPIFRVVGGSPQSPTTRGNPGTVLTEIFLFASSRLFLRPRHVLVIFFRFKDNVSFNLGSNVVYKFSCGRCNATYYGETCRHLNIRVGEHSGVSPLTGKKSKTKTTTAIEDHMLFCDHVVSLEDFKILASSNSEFPLRSRDKPELNRNEKSFPLYLFD